ncbi:endonuclease/exonuclease/phosphatase family protein [Micromonospora chersina]|uniref:endonuclease/exonuclease/phosphatase family protein n=1 Tax=Micromonospora chersina TaxID=47854 RepID=UPI0033BBE190
MTLRSAILPLLSTAARPYTIMPARGVGRTGIGNGGRRVAPPRDRRWLCSRFLAGAAVDGQPGMPTILCGDLNDGPDAVTTVLLEGPADGDVHRPDKGDAVRVYNLGRRLPLARAYSRIYQGRGELIDHILATRDLQLRLGSIDSLLTTSPRSVPPPAAGAAGWPGSSAAP